MENKTIQLVIEHEKGRIDKVLSELLPEVTRTTIQQWVKQEAVMVNDQVIKANYKVKAKDCIQIVIPEEEELKVEPENIPLEILFEDEDLLVLNKPSGMVVHPSKGHTSQTLVNALLYHVKNLSKMGEAFRPGIVHRIDKDTSGVLVVAKTSKAHLGLSEQLASHQMVRKYIALVEGRFEHITGTVQAPLARNANNRLKRSVEKHGKPAITHFTVLEQFPACALLELELETGRTHQIRTHMEYIGHPILNDPMYHPNGKQATEFGQYLHAKSLGFIHPITKEALYFEGELPEEFANTLSTLRMNGGH